MSVPSPPKPPHHTNSGYRNIYISNEGKNFGDFLKWKLQGDGPRGTKTDQQNINRAIVNHELIQKPGKAPQVTWIGHSTVLFQVGDTNIITDPIFSERCSPVNFAGPKRYQSPALALEELPSIDFAVISHNHYDHLDKPSVLALGNNVHWLVPLGLKTWFTNIGISRVTELDWWDEAIIDETRFVATPAQHWSARSLGDRFDTLWASWFVEVEGIRFWFGGDTGYNPIQFKEIGKRLGPMDIAAIPIGAYEPRWFMKDMHVNPEEALKIHQDINSNWSFGIHWGTFQLTDEGPLEPKKKLIEARQLLNFTEEHFTTLALGETLSPNTNHLKKLP